MGTGTNIQASGEVVMGVDTCAALGAETRGRRDSVCILAVPFEPQSGPRPSRVADDARPWELRSDGSMP